MTLRFHETTIYFKQFFAATVFDKSSFANLCEKIEEFPLKEDYSKIKGLYLEGEHFFKKVLIQEAKELDLDEIEQIKSITPIIDEMPLPFVIENNYFEVSLPTEGKSFEKIMDSVSTINKYFTGILESITGKKIEIHLRGGIGKILSRQIYKKAIPNFSKGTYKYETMMNKEVKSGEMFLPTEFEKLPDNVKKFVKVVRGQYICKLIDNKNRIILKQTRDQEIGLSLYSDQCEWFQNALNVCKKAELFEPAGYLPKQYHILPHLTGLPKRD